MPEIIAQLIAILGPLIAKVISDHQEATGELPTNEEMVARFLANADAYLAEGAAWKAQHPTPPTNPPAA